MRVSLKKLQGKRKRQKRYLVADIESADWTKFLVVGIFDGQQFRHFDSLADFLDFLLCEYSGWDCFCHFGGRFDFLFFLGEILKHDDIKIGPIIPRGSGILCFDVFRGDQSISFRDSSALLPFSLKRITEAFGVEHKKQEIDYAAIKKVTQELLEYLEYDCRGLYESLTKFYDWSIIRKCGGSYTVASQAMRVLRTYLENDLWFLSESMDKRIRPAYLGGRTEIFRPVYSGKRPLYCYDVNSLYPSVMHENEFPNSFEIGTNEFFEDRLGFYECEVDCPEMYVPPLGIVHNGKFVFPTGNFRGLFTVAEINYARTLGVRIKTGYGYLFSSAGRVFREFVSELFRIKQTSEKGSVDSTIAKLLLNSCYGRFAINSEKENIVFDDGTNGLKELRELQVGNKLYRLMLKPVELDTFSNVAIAAYVTSYARIYMHKLMLKCENELYYTDTDSLFTTRKFKESETLGGLKKEYECNSACFLLPKTYIAGSKIAMKGFDKKKIQHFTIKDFFSCLEGDLKALRIVQEPKFATFKTALRLGNLVTMTPKSTRQIRSKYDKRIIIKKGDKYDTKPINLKG